MIFSVPEMTKLGGNKIHVLTKTSLNCSLIYVSEIISDSKSVYGLQTHSRDRNNLPVTTSSRTYLFQPLLSLKFKGSFIYSFCYGKISQRNYSMLTAENSSEMKTISSI